MLNLHFKNIWMARLYPVLSLSSFETIHIDF